MSNDENCFTLARVLERGMAAFDYVQGAAWESIMMPDRCIKIVKTGRTNGSGRCDNSRC